MNNLLQQAVKDVRRLQKTNELYHSGGCTLNLVFDADYFGLSETEEFRISVPCTPAQAQQLQRKQQYYNRF